MQLSINYENQVQSCAQIRVSQRLQTQTGSFWQKKWKHVLVVSQKDQLKLFLTETMIRAPTASRSKGDTDHLQQNDGANAAT